MVYESRWGHFIRRVRYFQNFDKSGLHLDGQPKIGFTLDILRERKEISKAVLLSPWPNRVSEGNL
jgi:hypothetical protein